MNPRRRTLLVWSLTALLASACQRDNQNSSGSAAPPAATNSTKAAEVQTPAAALERRARSLERLRTEGVPVLPELPVIESESKAKLRSKDEVVDRAIALMAVAGKGERAPDELLERFRNEYEAAPKLSPEEALFIQNPKPADQDRTRFAWRYESLHVLLWALGFVESLPRPDQLVKASDLGRIVLADGASTFRDQARLRSATEILDLADLTYRYRWTVVDARDRNQPAPTGLKEPVVMERYQALSWLIRHTSQSWDQVGTGT